MRVISIACLMSCILFAGLPKRMAPRVLLDAYPMGAIRIVNKGISYEFDVGKSVYDKNGKLMHTEVSWGGETSIITEKDRIASDAWKKANSQLERLRIKNGTLLLDGLAVDLGNVDVDAVWEAFPWQGGLFCWGRTYPKKDNAKQKTIKDLIPSSREIEPVCAIWIDPKTRKGSDRWICGKCSQKLLVFPLPHPN